MNRFPRSWKRRSAYWHIDRALHREPSRSGPSSGLDRTPSEVAILADGSDADLFALARTLESLLRGVGSTVRIVVYFGDHDDHPEMQVPFFSEASLSWRGMPKDEVIQQLGPQRSGMLICLAGDSCLPLLLLASRWTADVKVAIQTSWPFFDIVLEGHAPPYAQFPDHLFSVLQTMKRTTHEHA